MKRATSFANTALPVSQLKWAGFSASLLLSGSGCGLMRRPQNQVPTTVVVTPADPDSISGQPARPSTLGSGFAAAGESADERSSSGVSQPVRFSNEARTTDRKPAGSAPARPKSAQFAGFSEEAFEGPPQSTSLNLFGELDGQANSSAQFGATEALTQITFSAEGADANPDVDPTGEHIVYSSTQHNINADLYIKRIDGSTVTQLTNDPGDDIMPSFSPDGKRIAFASNRAGTWDLFVMDVTGGPAVQVTNDGAHELHPSWSPDGKTIAYSRLNDAAGRWEVWVTEVENNAVKKFLAPGLFPEWSPADDSNLIVFQRPRERGSRLFGIWTIKYEDGEGREPTEIVAAQNAAAINPTWSPDGTMIAFVAIANPESVNGDRPATADVWVVSLSGTGKVNLTNGEYTNLQPAWGGDQNIYLVSNRSGNDNIWSIRPERAIAAGQAGPSTLKQTADAQGEEQRNER